MADWNRREDGCIVNDSFCGDPFELCDECKAEIRHRRHIEAKRAENDLEALRGEALASGLVALVGLIGLGIGSVVKAVRRRRRAPKPGVHVFVHEES